MIDSEVEEIKSALKEGKSKDKFVREKAISGWFKKMYPFLIK